MKRKSILAVIACCVLVLALGVGGVTWAFLQAQTDTKNNTFDAGSASIDIDENSSSTPESSNSVPTDGDLAVKQVCVSNTGEVSVYIRAMLIPGWKQTEGTAAAGDLHFGTHPYTVTGNTLVMGDITLELAADWQNHWFYDTDTGYFYCRDAIAPGNTTALLLETVRLNDGVTTDAWDTLQVEVLSDAVQSEAGAVTTVWPVQLTDGHLAPL